MLHATGFFLMEPTENADIRPPQGAAASVEAAGRTVLVVPRCPNGHAVPDGTNLCPTCGTFVEGAVPASPTAPVMPSVPGYELLQELGRGGMGIVYKALHLRLKRIVALKMILAGDFAAADARQRFQREAEAVARLHHPNVVQLYEIGEAGGKAFFSLEFVDGASLADRLRGRPFPPRQAAHLILMLAKAVHCAHEHGIIHRDLKPANILIAGPGAWPAEQWNPKIADFGLAKHLNEATQHTQSGAILGTPSYMAPEQAQGALDRIGPATDVYSLGAILYELLTGRPPFVAPTAYDTMAQVLHADPLPVRRLQAAVPRDLEIICLKCLHKESAKRYGSAHALAEDLQRFLEGAPIHARPTGPMERAVKWARRRPAVAALWLGAFVILAVTGSAVLVYDRHMKKTHAQAHAAALVRALPKVETAAVPRLLDELEQYRPWANELLWKMSDESPPESKECLHACLALLAVDAGHADYLGEQIFTVDFEAVPVMGALLKPHQARVAPKLWTALLDRESAGDKRLRAACVVAEYGPTDNRWNDVAPALVEPLLLAVRQNPTHYRTVSKALFPVRAALQPALVEVYRDPERTEVDRSFATSLLADFNGDQPETLADLFLNGDEKQAAMLFPKLARHRDAAVKAWENVLEADPLAAQADRERLAMRRANAGCGLLRFGADAPVWPLFKHQPDPSARTFLIQRLRPLGIDPAVIVARLKVEDDVSARRGLLWGLGTYSLDSMKPAAREERIKMVMAIHQNDLDPGMHGMAEWVLRNWRESSALNNAQKEWTTQGRRPPPTPDQKIGPRWFVNGEGQTMVVVPGPVDFDIGSPETEAEREGGPQSTTEQQRHQWIKRSYAIAAKEVTVEQYLRFNKDHNYRHDVSPTPDCPVNRVSWYQAAAYCNWLSARENIPRDQWCYVANDQRRFDDGMTMNSNYLDREGYRLPTEAEWEYACRAGATTSRYFGASKKLLPGCAWYTKNSLDRFMLPVASTPPNDLGLHDMLGNALEWCQNGASVYDAGDDREKMEQIRSKDSRILRGGSYNDHPHYVRCAHRFPFPPTLLETSAGFRVVRTIR
jgi:formylglycine-generating enzyme required for sulfatase activity